MFKMVTDLQVKRINYLMITPSLPVNLQGKQASILPRGIPILVTTSYHDNTGRTFDSISGGSSCKARASRIDALQIETAANNNTYKITTLTEDRVSVKVHDDNNLVDHLAISVGEAIEPALVSFF